MTAEGVDEGGRDATQPRALAQIGVDKVRHLRALFGPPTAVTEATSSGATAAT